MTEKEIKDFPNKLSLDYVIVIMTFKVFKFHKELL